MYYVNRNQIEERLAFVPTLAAALRELRSLSASRGLTLLESLAEERAVHLAIETVTDVGSLMIDGFIMRDASSYEDIVDILNGETVLDNELAAALVALVKLRKPLVQDYTNLDRERLHAHALELPEALERFAGSILAYLQLHL